MLLKGGEDENLPIFVRLKQALNKVFYNEEDLFLKDFIFVNHAEYYSRLKQLHAMKIELSKLKSLCSLSKPYVIEFSGTPRTGKTTIVNNLYDFFKKGGFKVTLIEEFTTSKYFKENLKNMDINDQLVTILEEVHRQLKQSLNSENDIILIDHSINDRQIWNYRRYVKGDMPQDVYFNLRDRYKGISKELIDFLVITYADPFISLRRDYTSSLALEERSFLNEKNIKQYNDSLHDLKSLFSESVDCNTFLDTSNMKIEDVSVEIAFQILAAMRKKYIDIFQKLYN